MSACHRSINMTEVAQVAAVADHDMDDVTNEDEHCVSDGENKENDVPSAKEDADEDDGSKEKTLHDDESIKTDTRQRNDAKEEKDKASKAVNGVTKKTKTEQKTQPDTNEDSNISDLALKKEASDEFMAISDKIWRICALHRNCFTCCFTSFRNFSGPESQWPEATFQSRAKKRETCRASLSRCRKPGRSAAGRGTRKSSRRGRTSTSRRGSGIAGSSRSKTDNPTNLRLRPAWHDEA